MSRLDKIREAVDNGYDYSVETAEEHVKILLEVIDVVMAIGPADLGDIEYILAQGEHVELSVLIHSVRIALRGLL